MKIIPVIIGLFLTTIVGCASRGNVLPNDRARNSTFRMDCCDPGTNAGTKELCRWAKDAPSHTLVDKEGNRYEFIWSDCEVGSEPWRRWEK